MLGRHPFLDHSVGQVSWAGCRQRGCAGQALWIRHSPRRCELVDDDASRSDPSLPMTFVHGMALRRHRFWQVAQGTCQADY